MRHDLHRRRVLMVMDSLAVGGTETHVLSLVKSLKRLGQRPIAAAAGGLMYEAYAAAGCPIFFVDLTPGRLMDPAVKPKVIRELKRLMTGQRVDVVHAHQTPSGLYAAIAAGELGIPVVFTVHGAYYSHEQLYEMRRLCHTLVSVSRPVHRYLAKLGIRSELVPNGIDPAAFRPGPPPPGLRESLGIPDDAPVVVYASRLAWDKATVCSMLMTAAARLRQSGGEGSGLHLVVVGDGKQYGELEQLARELNGEAGGAAFIHMAGSQVRRIRDYFALADLAVGTGRVALEAMFCDKPVLAIGNHGYCGMVEPSGYALAWDCYFGDHDSIARPSEAIIADQLSKAFGSRETLSAIGEQGGRWARERFDTYALGAKLRRIYESAVGGRATEGA